jgi:hypothetical protein
MFRLVKRRGRDSNPRDASRRPTVFKTAAFVRSATPPVDMPRRARTPPRLREQIMTSASRGLFFRPDLPIDTGTIHEPPTRGPDPFIL